MTPTQRDNARLFASLHRKGEPLILFNAWDAGSARVIAESGGRAIATGSASVAAAHGFADGEKLPLAVGLDNLRRIVAAVELPVSIDLEGGYDRAPEGVAETVTAAIAAGAVGCNFEDQVVGGEGLYPADDQCDRILAIRRAADEADLPFFINARTDLFLKSKPDQHASHVDEAIRRGHAYAEAGANGLFVPGLVNEEMIARICAKCPLPVNVMALPGGPPAKRLAQAGVARISHGPGPYRLAMRALAEAARTAQQGG